MSKPEKYMLAHLIEPQEPGFEFNTWPLHVTLVPWFEVDENQFQDLDQALEGLVEDFAPFASEATEKANFGKHGNAPVTLIQAEDERWDTLHNSILDLLSDLSLKLTITTHIGSDFTPHVATRGDREFAPGTEHLVDSITLVKAMEEYVEQPMRRKIIKTYQFSSI